MKNKKRLALTGMLAISLTVVLDRFSSKETIDSLLLYLVMFLFVNLNITD